MQDIDLKNITIDKITLPIFVDNDIEAEVLRLDKIHPLIPGNKWFKLRYYLDEALRLNKKNIVTFGGAWSNHIIATATMGNLYGLATIGIIRGEEASELSPTLAQARAMGMQLIFISRDDYKQKKLPEEIPSDAYIINEGGYGKPGAEGASTIFDHCSSVDYSHICCACGTGTMAAGLANGTNEEQELIAISVMKNNHELEEDIRSLLKKDRPNISLNHEYHFGGYAKHKPELLNFMNEFYRQTSIPSDFVYTGKLFYAIADLASKNYFPTGSRLLLIHSGGLQGNSSLNKGTLIF